MKKIFIGLLAILALCGCSETKEDKARELIENQLRSGMTEEEWDSYLYVGMTKMDSTYSSFYSTEAGKACKAQRDSINACVEAFRQRMAAGNAFGGRNQAALQDSLSILERQQTKIVGQALAAEQDYEGAFNGYRTRFRYKVNNANGVQVLEAKWFFFNEDVTEITRSFR